MAAESPLPPVDGDRRQPLVINLLVEAAQSLEARGVSAPEG
jgi:hypothetical protein